MRRDGNVEDGQLLALRPAPGHPTGQALCVKGKAAPEIVNHPDRLLLPLRRTAPKGPPTRAGSRSAGTKRSTQSPQS